MLQVQNGCDHRCTFCIIPYGRGNSRSVGAGAVVAEARRLVEAGFKEIVLSGVDLTAYGADLPGRPSSGSLAAQILKHVPELQRLRLSSIDSIEADDALLRLIAEEERLMPHLHLVGAVGRRPHPEAHEAPPSPRAHDRILQPDAAAAPGYCVRRRSDRRISRPRRTRCSSTQCRSIDEAGLSYLHVFPFSPRRGTPAARMKQVPHATIKERARILRAKGQAALSARLASLIGSEQEILVEKPGLGRTRVLRDRRVRG